MTKLVEDKNKNETKSEPTKFDNIFYRQTDFFQNEKKTI